MSEYELKQVDAHTVVAVPKKPEPQKAEKSEGKTSGKPEAAKR